jgi:hypothetical protein
MSTAQGWRQTHRWVIIVVLVALVIAGIATYRYARHNQEADRKADQLTTELREAGLRVPASHDTITNVLGADGGAICDNPSSALRKAIVDSRLINGAASVGQRPVIGEVDLVTGTVIVLEVYCLDKVDAFQDAVASYRLDTVAND